MDVQTQQHFHDLESNKIDVQYEAYKNILAETKTVVEWAYEVWEQC